MWNNNISSSNPSAPTNVTAVKNGNNSALVSWNSSVSGVAHTVFARNSSREWWYKKGRTSGTSLTISFDDYDVYTIRVLSSVNDLYSDYSNVFAIQIYDISSWEWFTPKTSGLGFNLTKDEWIAFCNKINEVRTAKGLTAYSFTTSSTYIGIGKPFYAWIFLQAANAIDEINGQVSSELLSVASGGYIYAWYFNNLKTALNNAISLPS